MKDSETAGGDGPHLRRLTVANIREQRAAEYAEVVFLESARFYRLDKNLENFQESLRALHQALDKNESLTIVLQAPESDEILGVQP